MSGWKDWAIGEVVTESDFQSFVQDQVVQVYDDATDRDNTLGTAVAEGMVAYLRDTNQTQAYDGTAWVNVGEAGDITAVTAGTALTGGGTAGDVTLDVDISALATAHAGNALNANGELLDVDESAITVAQSQVTDLVSDLADKADNADFTGGTAGYTALSNGTAGLSYQPVSHNYIINGAFDIWQRGTSFSSAGYRADRYDQGFTTASVTYSITQEDFTAGELEVIGFGEAKHYARIAVTTMGATGQWIPLANRIEDVRNLSGQTVTFSFWAKANAVTTIDSEIVQWFDVKGAAPVAVVGETGISIGTTWQRYSYTKTLGDTSGQTIGVNSNLEVNIKLVDAEGVTLDTWGWQLEAGSIATPFKRNANSIAGELAACQRYYQRYQGSGIIELGSVAVYSSTGVNARLPLATNLRQNSGTLEFSGLEIVDTALSIIPVSSASLNSFAGNSVGLNLTVSGATQHRPGWLRTSSGSGFVAISAEL